MVLSKEAHGQDKFWVSVFGFSWSTLIVFPSNSSKKYNFNYILITNFKNEKLVIYIRLYTLFEWKGDSMKMWQIFKEAFLSTQQLSISRYSKLGKEGKRPAWLKGDLLVKQESKKKCTGARNRDRYCGKSIKKLLGCVGMGSERPRPSLN